MVRIGIDFGDQNCCIASGQNRVINVISNVVEGRVMSSFVSFGDRCRNFCLDAQNSHSMKIDNTIFGFKKLLGRRFSDPFVTNEKTHLPYGISEDQYGFIQVKVHHLGKEEHFSVTQIAAMLLTHLKQHVQKTMQDEYVECVLSVPSYFKNDGRLALLDAARMANLNVKKLMNEHAAVALFYGFYKSRRVLASSPIIVAFVDMGHSSLQVSICSTCVDDAKVLATASSLSVGGRDFDAKIAEKFTTKEIQHRLSKDASAALRLLNECRKFKIKMSTCDLELPFEIGNLVDNEIISGKLGRKEFEEICKPLLNKVKSTMRKALVKSGKKVDRVELIGGATIMPAIKEVAQEVFGCEPSATLPRESVIAEGCALQCEILGGRTIKSVDLYDLQPYPIAAVHCSKDEESKFNIFCVDDPVPLSITFTVLSGEIRLYYGNQKEEKPNKNAICSFKNVSYGDLLFKIDTHGILRIIKTQRPALVSNENPCLEEQQHLFNTTINKITELFTKEMQGDTLEKEELGKIQEKIKELDTEVMQCDILKRDLIQLIKKEVELIVADMNEVKRLSEKNCFEKKLYEFKDSLLADLSPFITDEKSNDLISKLDKEQDWLEEKEYSIEEYKKKFSPHQDRLKRLTSLKQKANAILDEAKLFQQKVVQFEGISHSTDFDRQVTNGHGKKVLDYVGIFYDFLEFFKNSLQRAEGKLAGFLTIEELKKGQYFLLTAILDVKKFFPSVPTLIDVMVLSGIILSRMGIYQQVYHWNEDLKQTFLLKTDVREPFFWMNAFDEYLCLFHYFIEQDIFISHQERKNFIEIHDNLHEKTFTFEKTFDIKVLESLCADMHKCFESIPTFILRANTFEAKTEEKICQLKSALTHELNDLAGKALQNDNTRGWKKTLSDFLILVDIIHVRQLSFFSFEQEKKDFEECSTKIRVHLEQVDLRVIEDIEGYILRIQKEIKKLQKREEAYSEVIVQLDKLSSVFEDVQSQTGENRNGWKGSFQHYLTLYNTAMDKIFSDVISSKEKDASLAILNKASDALSTIETSSMDSLVTCMSSLYVEWDLFASKKVMYDRLADEISFLKGSVNKKRQYEIKSNEDFKQSQRTSYGKVHYVHEAELVESKEKVAVKRFKSCQKPRLADLVKNKNKHEFFKKLDHKNILNTYDMFEQNDFCYIISEFCSNQDIESFRGSRKMSEEGAFYVMKAVCEVLLYLKSMNVILSSIDLSHILLTEDFIIKVDVFSLYAKQTSEIPVTTQSLSRNDKFSNCDAAADINTFDLGCLLFYCLKGHYPHLYGKKRSSCYIDAKQLGIKPDSAADLISRMLQNDAKKRITFDEALKHSFFEGVFSTNLLIQMFNKYKELLEPVLSNGELERFVSKESQEKIKEAIMNLQDLVFQNKSCDFEVEIEKIHDFYKIATMLKGEYVDVYQELDNITKNCDDVRSRIDARYLKKSEEHKVANIILMKYQQVIDSWKNTVSTTDLFSELPISRQFMKDANNCFLEEIEPFLSNSSETEL